MSLYFGYRLPAGEAGIYEFGNFVTIHIEKNKF
jgi:hypothetical protein